MKAYELATLYREKKPEGHFFDKETLKYFGESLSKMKVDNGLFEHIDYRGEKHQCYKLTTTQIWDGKPMKAVFLFDKDTMEDFYIEEDR